MPYLPEALASIQAQTYRNWTVLAWDNGSTDGTIDVLREWIPSRLPGRIVTDHPLALGACRREMVKAAETEFCALMDADDVSVSNRLEMQVAYLINHPGVAVVGSQVSRLDVHGVNHGKFLELPSRHQEIVLCMLHSNGLAQPSVLFRRSAVLETGNYRDVEVEDYDLWLRLAARHRLANLATPLLLYRLHAQSTTEVQKARSELRELLDRRFYEHAGALCSRPEKELRLLRERKHPCALMALFRIARELSSSGDTGLLSLLTSKAFRTAGRSLSARRDIVSRLCFTYLIGATSIRPKFAKALRAVAHRNGKSPPVAMITHGDGLRLE